MPTNDLPPAWRSGHWRGAGVVGLCLISGVVGGALTRNFGTSDYTISYADFISIMLTAVSLLMTVLAIFLAVFGFIGWNSIQTRVHDRTKEFLDEEFKEGKSLYTMLESRVTEIIYEGIMPALSDVDGESADGGEHGQ